MTGSITASLIAAAVVAVVIVGGIWLLMGTSDTLVDGESRRFGLVAVEGSTPAVISIVEGESADDVGQKLEDAGVIQSQRHFTTLAALMGVTSALEAGDYEFIAGTTALAAVQRISQGRTALSSVTIPEGWRSEEIAQQLEASGTVTGQDFLAALDDEYIATFLETEPSLQSLEGFLFPATYNFPSTIDAHAVVQEMVTAFDERYALSIQEPLTESPLTLHEAVTLASIIEREAVVENERPRIASVFRNRLDAGILLQADPTVQYAIASDPASVAEYGFWKQELTEADLAIESPYNTYVFPGLPPGPIANPGEASILAALQPEETDLLYFVACQDGSGRHLFGETLDDHLANIDIVETGECPA